MLPTGSKSEDNDLLIIKNWLEKQRHLPNSLDDQRIRSFLRGCNSSLEKCKTKLDNYYTMKSLLPEFFSNRDISNEDMREVLSVGNIAVLAKQADGATIIATYFKSTDFKPPNLNRFFTLCIMVFETLLARESYNGHIIIIFDASALLPKYLPYISLASVKKFTCFCQEAAPARIKGIHFVRMSPFSMSVLQMVTSFLKEKLKKRICIHPDVQSLKNCFDLNVLPAEYGGNGASMKEREALLLQTLAEHTEWFQEQDLQMVDESKRQEPPKKFETLFGLEGSFRSLNVD